MLQLLGKMVESLVIEFDQEKFEKFLSLGSASPKAMRQYRKVSSGTCSRISSETSSKVARTTAHSVNGATSNDVLKTSRATHAARINVSQKTNGANTSVHDHNNGEDHSAITLLSTLCNFRLPRVPNNPCDSTGMLNVDEGIVLVDN